MNDYAATGMKTMFFQGSQYQYHFVNGTGNKEVFATSPLKSSMDRAKTAGIEKGIIVDWRIYCLSCQTVDCLYKVDDLTSATWQYVALSEDRQKEIANQLTHLGTSTFQFETKSEFYNFIVGCLKEYESHPIFTGVILKDEPTYEFFNASADIYKAIKAYNPDIRVVQNLFPIYADRGYLCEGGYSKTQVECYTSYLTSWLDKTGADYIMFDSYPMDVGSIQRWYLEGMRLAAEICEARNIDLCLIMQTCSIQFNGNLGHRQCTEADLYWQTNVALGYGVDKIIYYSYAPDVEQGLEGIQNGSTFINLDGTKTDLYYSMKDIMGEMNDFAPVIRNFDYNASITVGYNVDVDYDYETNDTFETGIKVYVSEGDLVLTTELKDSAKGNYLYMGQNILDPSASGDTDVNLTFDFGDEYDYAVVFDKGQATCVKLVNGTYFKTLSAGQAIFVMPY